MLAALYDSDLDGMSSLYNLVSDAGKYLQASTDGTPDWVTLTALVNPLTTIGDMIYASDSDGNLDRVGIGLAGQALVSSTDGIPEWQTLTALTNPMTATGDIIFASDSDGTPDNLAIGTAGYVLTSAAGLPAWVAPSGSVDGWIATGETWVYASSDDQTYTVTIADDAAATKYSAGMRVKLTNVTEKYFIITSSSDTSSDSSTDTTLTLYGGTDYDISSSDAITDVYYSREKAPFGFPLSPAKWTVEATDINANVQSTPIIYTWYNLGGSISVPIGEWHITFSGVGMEDNGGVYQMSVCLSTANNSASDTSLIHYLFYLIPSNTATMMGFYKSGHIKTTAKTTYYMNARTDGPSGRLITRGDYEPSRIKITSSYL